MDILFKFELYSIGKKFSQNEHFVSLVSIGLGIVKFIQNKIFYFLSIKFPSLSNLYFNLLF